MGTEKQAKKNYEMKELNIKRGVLRYSQDDTTGEVKIYSEIFRLRAGENVSRRSAQDDTS